MLPRLLAVLRRHPWMTGAGGVLVLALIGTGIARWMVLQRVVDRPEDRREAVVEDAFATVEEKFEVLQRRVRGQAERLATDSVVAKGLAAWANREERPTALTRHVLDVTLGDRTSVEVFSTGPGIVAWNGRRVPLGTAPNEEAFLERPQTAIVASENVRRALTVWWPVQTDGRTLGAVRVTRTIQYRPPVKNRYVKAYSLERQWNRATDASIRLQWGEASGKTTAPHRVLKASDGTTLGTVTVSPPSSSQLERRSVQLLNDLLVGWVALLAVWGIAGIAQWYLCLARRPGAFRLPRARTAVAGRFAVLAAVWVGGRYLLLDLNVPGRWLTHMGLFTSLFDPTQLASTLGGGVLRSVGDLFLTGLWAALLAVGGLHLALRYRVRASSGWDLLGRLRAHPSPQPSVLGFFSVLVLVIGMSLGSVLALAYVVRRAVLDSTLDFFSRTGLLPEPLLAIVLGALILLVIAVFTFGVAFTWVGLRLGLRCRPEWPQGLVPFSVVALFVLAVAGVYLGTEAHTLVPFPYLLIMVGVMTAAALYGLVGRNGGAEVFTIRGLLLGLFVVTLLFYPLLYQGMDAQRRERMEEAVSSFEAGYDPRALYSTRQVLRAAGEELGGVLQDPAPIGTQSVDSVATRLLRRSLLSSLTTYEVSLSLFRADGRLFRYYESSGRQSVRGKASPAARSAFEALRQTHDLQLSPGPVLDRFAADRRGRRTGRFEYAGLLRIGADDSGYWVLVRADPRSLLPGTGPGVPQVLLPDGSFSDLYAELSLATFRDGRIVRQFGPHFGRTQLPPAHAKRLREEREFWRAETVQGQQYLTYYTRPSRDETSATVAARIPALLAFDHLYYLLRLTVVGLVVGMVVYLLGLYGRYRRGLVPAERVRFRNKVLNAFLIVGIVSMVAVGVVGVRVVTGESERVVERRLRDHLTRVEKTLALEGTDGEPLWRVADRMSVDSLAARVGLDLRVYEDAQLVGTSRPRLVRDGFVDERLPGPVHYELYDEAYRFTVAEATIGTFRYMVGYRTLVDESGRPRLVVGVPTLAQQEQVAEEQARTLAYLFGALLVLVVVVMLTAVVLAGALAQPIARLRAGLEAVGEGRFAQALPVNTRDEVGDLVRTFNEMRAQLAESRRKLAQQEREIAWREMARQVAHEIKNPLTPMKLSIQHLRRAFKQNRGEDEGDADFASLFNRITTTLIEQIESLVRIADEFSTFARLPTRVLETLDLNEVVQEAVRLMERETDTETIELDLHDESLPVEADREELRRTHINLLKNALQAIPDDREGHVRVETAWVESDQGPMVESRVTDNGTGIPPKVQDKVFEPNFSTRTGGTGLGLAIAQKSIDDLGGTIDYETTEGAGTTFWIRLPRAEAENDER